MTDPAPLAVPAATLVVMRDAAAGAPELLIVERAKAMAFAGGMLVFPGGRVDPGDLAAADGDVEGAARLAAIRECVEEAGVATGLVPPPDAAALALLRRALHAGTPIAAAAAAAGLALDPAALVPWARWRPRLATPRAFDTRFYLAQAPAGAPAARVDATENSRLFWASAAAVLRMCDRGEAQVIFPTRRNLERLAQFDSFAAAAAHAAATPVRTITPRFVGEGAARRLTIPDDAGYPVTSELASTVRRG